MKVTNSVELYNKEFPPITFVVEEIMTEGLNVIVGQPKSGKSWFALSLCIQVSKGEPFLDFKTLESEVLYLCLEGGEQRLGKRFKELTNNPPKNLFFAVNIKCLNFGFKEEIVKFLEEHPKAKLIVIDTWQKIRDASGGTVSSYQSDYNEMQVLREITEKYNICILLVHHTRKMLDDDPFNMITGTTGFTGAVDNMYVLVNESRISKKARLHVTGRDIKDTILHLESDKETHEWTLNYIEDEDRIDFPEDIFFHKIVELVECEKEFNNTPMELKNKLKESYDYEISERVITKRLIKYKEFLVLKNINFFNTRTGQERSIFLKKMS